MFNQTKPTRSKEVKSEMAKAHWKVISRGLQNTTYATLLGKKATIKLNLLYLGFETLSDI